MMKFYMCRICGNVMEKIVDGGNTPTCCGRMMTELKPESTDGAREKHVPQTEIENEGKAKMACVQVGEEKHPMEMLHYIEWIVLETNKGVYRKHLHANEEPVACFMLSEGEEIKNTYAYCNLHGLWIERRE